MQDFSIVTEWIHGTMTSVMPEWLAIVFECLGIGVALLLA